MTSLCKWNNAPVTRRDEPGSVADTFSKFKQILRQLSPRALDNPHIMQTTRPLRHLILPRPAPLFHSTSSYRVCTPPRIASPHPLPVVHAAPAPGPALGRRGPTQLHRRICTQLRTISRESRRLTTTSSPGSSPGSASARPPAASRPSDPHPEPRTPPRCWSADAGTRCWLPGPPPLH